MGPAKSDQEQGPEALVCAVSLSVGPAGRGCRPRQAGPATRAWAGGHPLPGPLLLLQPGKPAPAVGASADTARKMVCSELGETRGAWPLFPDQSLQADSRESAGWDPSERAVLKAGTAERP